MPRQLSAERIEETVRALARRIDERFPTSGLAQVCSDLQAIARETAERVIDLGRPHRLLRAGVAMLIVLLLGVVVVVALNIHVSGGVADAGELVQALEAGLNTMVFLGIAIFFLTTLEQRLKRRRALQGLHDLRSVAHIVDMHQLTKDPELVMSGGPTTASSPQRRVMTRFELSRYLDYCSEMLAITGKVAALYAQYVNDPVVLDAVKDIEGLTTGISGKVWQKIMILDLVAPPVEEKRATGRN